MFCSWLVKEQIKRGNKWTVSKGTFSGCKNITHYLICCTISKQSFFPHSCIVVCVFRERRPTFVWRWTVLAAPATVALILVAAVEAGATACHGATPHVAVEAHHITRHTVSARALAPKTHMTLIKPPASSTRQCILEWRRQTNLHGTFAVFCVCILSCCVFLFPQFSVFNLLYISHLTRYYWGKHSDLCSSPSPLYLFSFSLFSVSPFPSRTISFPFLLTLSPPFLFFSSSDSRLCWRNW